MEVTVLLFLAPIIALPFIGQRWSLIATYVTYGALIGLAALYIFLAYTNPSHMSDGIVRISVVFGAICIVLIALARVIYKRKQARSFSVSNIKL
ncbi:MAG: hypothetical protein RIR89_1309 [Actinomycetota bacterium]